MEQNANRLGRQKPEPENHDGTKTVSWKNSEPHSTPELFGEQTRNPTRNQKMMMGQNAQRVGRQTLEPYPEPQKDDGAECQKNRETNPGTLPGTRKWWWNKMPKEYGDKPRNREVMMEQNAKRVGKQTREPYPEWWRNRMPKE